MNYRTYKTILLITSILFLVNHKMYSQDEDDKWVVGAGVNVIDIRSPHKLVGVVKDYLNGSIEDINASGSLLRVFVGRYLANGITIQVAASANEIQKGFRYATGDPLTSDLFFAMDGKLKYDLNYLLKSSTGPFDPFVLVGGGYSKIGETSNINIAVGWGFNLWFSRGVGLNFQSDYNHNPKSNANDYFQHSIGLVFKLSTTPRFKWRGR